MAYCTVEEVLGAIKESAYDALLGDEYIEDLEERRRRLVPYVEEKSTDIWQNAMMCRCPRHRGC